MLSTHAFFLISLAQEKNIKRRLPILIGRRSTSSIIMFAMKFLDRMSKEERESEICPQNIAQKCLNNKEENKEEEEEEKKPKINNMCGN